MLMLPYFKFNKNNDGMKDGALCAESDEFVLNSKYALRYYHDFNVSKSVNRTYLIGSDFFENLTFAVGGIDQQNKALIPELISAVGILQFFSDADMQKPGSLRSVLIARRKTNGNQSRSAAFVSFDEIPDHSNIKSTLLNFVRFSLVYNRLLQITRSVCQKPKLGREETWVPYYFPVLRKKALKKAVDDSGQNGSVASDRDRLVTDIEAVSDYLTRFLDWSVDLLSYIEEINHYKIDEIRQGTGNDSFDLKDISSPGVDGKFDKMKRIIRDESFQRRKNSFFQLYGHVRKLTTV